MIRLLDHAARDNARRIVVPAACGLALSVAASCTKNAPPPPARVPVAVAVASRMAAPYDISANGSVEPLQTVAVTSQVTGTLTAVDFAEGQDVSAGQVLFRIDPRAYQAALEQAQGALAKDEATAESMKKDAERYAALVGKDYVTKQQADQAQAAAVAAQATVAADRGAVENARLNLEYATIRAPIAGRTGSLLVHKGNLVKAQGQTLVVINQIRPILVRFAVPAAQLPDLQRYGAGKPLAVHAVPTADSSGAPIAGTLSFLDNAVDSTTGTVTLKASFANDQGRLWPGQFAAVSLQLYVQQNALVVPSQAVLTGQEGAYVFVIDGSGTAQPRSVSPGRSFGRMTIIERGLTPGERVVTDGQSRLQSGTKVDIKAVAPDIGAAPQEQGTT